MNAKKLLSTLLSAAMAVSMLAGCFGGGGNKNYSDKAADAANAAQSTVVFATDAKLSKSLQDALENFTQLDDIKDAMEADENLKSLLTSGWDLDVVAEQGEDAEAAAKAIAEKYILSIVSGKKAEGKIAMVLHDGNGYYYVAVLTYGNGGSGSGGGAGGGSGSGDGDHPGGNPGGGTDPDDPNKPGTGDDDDEEENGPVAQSIEVTKDPNKLHYFLNDYFDPDGMEVTLHTNQGERELDSTEYTIVKEAFSETGEQKVTIIYYDQETGKELYAYVTVNVSAPEVTSIEVTKAPTKTRYLVDEEYFDPAGMEVKAYFDDGSWRVLAPSEYTVDKGPFSNVGDNEVKITYNDASTSVTVTGVKFVETSVTYSDTPSLGDSFNEGLLTVIAVYDDGIKNVEKEVKKFTYDIDDINADGQFTDTYVTVEVSYTDEFGVNRTGSGDIEVAYVAPVAVGLEVSLADPDKTFYVGDSITKNDLIVYAVYKNVFGNESREKIDGYAITNPNGSTFDKAGDCEVTVEWNDLTGSTTVTVEEKEHIVTVKWNEAQGSVKINDTTYTGGEANVKIEAGTKVVVQAVPYTVQGYVFDGFTGTSKEDGTVNEIAHTYTIDSLSDDVSIGVNFKLTQVTVTLKLEGNGSGTVKFNDQKVEDGKFITVNFKQDVTIKAEADSGSKLIFIKDSVGNDVTKVHPSDDITITVKFESVQPEIARIEVTQDKDIYVGQTLTSEYLTVTAYDSNDNVIENPNLELTTISKTTFDEANSYNIAFTFKVGNSYKSVTASIIVQKPDVTITFKQGEEFKQGETLFYSKKYGTHEKELRKGMKIQISYGKNDLNPKEIEITEGMIGRSLHDLFYEDFNGNQVSIGNTFTGFDRTGEQNVWVSYTKDNITYEFIVRINVKGA